MAELSTRDVSEIVALLPHANAEQKKLSERYVRALAAIAPDLLPQISEHPFAAEIARGTDALVELARDIAVEKDVARQAQIVDAIAIIFEETGAITDVTRTLRDLLIATRDGTVASTCARALAVARDPWLLDAQRTLLFAKSESTVRAAARLIGWARDQESLNTLIALLQPSRLSIAGPVLWAIGRIGASEALPVLHAMLGDRVLVRDVVETLEKIGSAESIVPLLGVLSLGEESEREAAARAIAHVALANHEAILADVVLNERARAALAQVIDGDSSRVARYFAIVAHGRFGGRLSENRLFAALGAPLGDTELDSMSAYFTKRGAPTK